MDKRQLFIGDRVVRTENNFGVREGETGTILNIDSHGDIAVEWDNDNTRPLLRYYTHELDLILEEHNDW